MRRSVISGTVFAGLLAGAAQAGVTHIEIAAVKPVPGKDGAPDYELVTGTFTGTLDPADPANRIITDLALAPRDARGRVAYRGTFRLNRPADPARASGVLLYDVPNRGMVISGMPDADPAGHIRVASGWQGDIAPSAGLQTITVPVARRANGKPLTGPVLARFVNAPANASTMPIGGGLGMQVVRPEPVSLDSANAQLWQDTRDGRRVRIAKGAFAFADCSKTAFPGTPDPRKLCLKDGFDPDAAYTLAYTGKDPLVLGIGFAATRDLVAYLRSGKPDAGGQANPAGGTVRWAVATGNSQSGNFLRSFVHLGFNADEAGAKVFDGMQVNIAARQVPLNLRFGVPGGAAGTFEPGSEGTLWWGSYDDKARRQGLTSLLARCTAANACPKIVDTLGSAEFWGLRASPNFVGVEANADIPLPGNVRRYYFPSVTHGGGRGAAFAGKAEPGFGRCLLPGNPVRTAESTRASLNALIDWVRSGKEPPPSRYPTLAAGDLVPPNATAMGWPAIPGAPMPDGHLNMFVDQDFGPSLRARDLSGAVTVQPPRVRRTFASLVPRVNADGNETAGVPSVELLVPIGTFTGWNEQAAGYYKGRNCGFEGGFIPFARSKAEREAKGDPRLSLEERYGDRAGFLSKVREAVARQQAEGWLTPDDAARVLREADAGGVLR